MAVTLSDENAHVARLQVCDHNFVFVVQVGWGGVGWNGVDSNL